MPGQHKISPPSRERKSQKSRTRAALVSAASELVEAGKQPTVSEAAQAADISRATAYRYFPTQELLLAEVALFAAGGPLFPELDATVPLPEAIGQLIRRVGIWAYENETALRTLLRLSLDPHTGVRRPGHRREWISDALSPVRKRLKPELYNNLVRALTLTLGIDPVVVMKDIARASREEALTTLEWTARTLVDAALSSASDKAARNGRSPFKVPPSKG
jgi:AcrR family transcriptional regulator